VPVGVVGADREERDPRAGRGQEARVGVGAAVVRHLEHVGREVGPRSEDAGLGRRAEVTGEQDRDAAVGDPDDQREVVRLGSGRGPLRRRSQDLDRRRPHAPPVAGYQHGPLRAGAAHERVHRSPPVVRRGQGGGGHHADVASVERALQTAHVVGIEVREQDEGKDADTEAVEAPVDGGDVRSGVDQHALPRPGGQHEGVTLPDVAGDEDGPGGWPPAQDLAHRPADHDQAHQSSQGQRSGAGEPPERPQPSQEEAGEQHGASGTRRPAGRRIRHPRCSRGHQHQPADGPAGDPDERIGQRRAPRADHCGRQAQHGGRRDRRRREQVRRQRHQADGSGEAGDQRRGRRPGSRAHRQGVGEEPWPTPITQPARPARGEQDDGRGGHHGESEAAVAGQSGIDQQQDADGTCESRDSRPRPARGKGQEGDAAHGGSPEDARTRSRQDHEAEQRQHGHDRLQPPVDGPAPQRPQDAGEHDRHVGAGNRRQVRQAGATELLDEYRVHATRVAHGQARQQAGGPVRQHALRRCAEPVAQSVRRPLQQRRFTDERGRSPGRQHGDHALAGPGHRRSDAGPDSLTRRQVPPPLGGSEQEHLGLEPGPASPVGHGGHGRVGHHAGRTDARQQMRVAVQLQGHHRRPAVLGDRAQR
jgi:hypothetical protein